MVDNTGVMTDVIVQASVRDLATGDLIDGLPLTSLHNLTGIGSLDLYWDSAGLPFGHYQMMVELRDTQGNLLGTAVDDFQLGIVAGEVTSLEASQTAYTGGESILLSMTFVNTGTVPITGTGVIEVLGTEALTTPYRITAPINGLAPGASVQISGYLEASALDRAYSVVAHAKYYSQVSEAANLTLNRISFIYLPLITAAGP